MADDSEPFGSRHVPPSRPATGLDFGDSQKRVLVELQSAEEARSVAKIFESLGWVVDFEPVKSVLGGDYHAFVADNPFLAELLYADYTYVAKNGILEKVPVVLIVEPGQTQEGYDAQGDFVIERPFHPEAISSLPLFRND